MRYRDLVRSATKKVKACRKHDAPEWLLEYAKASMSKADYFFARRRGVYCRLRCRAMDQLLQLLDVLRHYLMSRAGPRQPLI